MAEYIDKITATNGTTYDIKDTISGYTTNTGTVTGMTTTAGSHTAGAQTVTSGIITTNIPTKTSHLTNDSGFITTDSDEKLKTTSLSTGTTSYLLSGPAKTTAANKYYVPDITVYRNNSGPTYLTVGSVSGAYDGWLGLANTGASKGLTIIKPGATGNITLTLPNATGTIALTANIPTVPAWAQASTKPRYTASEVGALPTDFFIWDTYSQNITVPGSGGYNFTMGTLTQHSGYTLRGYINQNGGYTDQWLVSYGTYGSNVVAMVYSKYGASLTKTISCTAIWTKNL